MNPDELNRTLKIEIDDGRAKNLADARQIVANYRLGIRLGHGFERNWSATAAALTAINAAVRAFPGGVLVEADPTAIVSAGWGLGRALGAVLLSLGATCVGRLPADLPYVISIGDSDSDTGNARVLHATWDGWAGGVVIDPADRGTESDAQPLVGTLAGAMAVSEAFQATRGFAMAARRAVGISLWRPDLAWRDPAARGEALELLPAKAWLLGLGHLGQAMAWSLGCLPFPPNATLFGLMDPEAVVAANTATGLLTVSKDVGLRKTRVVAASLEARGMSTVFVERVLDDSFRPQSGEPLIAFAGFDRPEPRRLLESVGLVRAVDTGLGGGPHHYLDLMIHAFPSELRATTAFPSGEPPDVEVLLREPAYAAEMARREASGQTEGEARCGALEVAGRTVGAAFVGAVTSTLALAEELRALVDGPQFQVVSMSLRSPDHVEAVPNPSRARQMNAGFVRPLRN